MACADLTSAVESLRSEELNVRGTKNDIIIVDLVWSPKKGERSQLRLRLHRRE